MKFHDSAFCTKDNGGFCITCRAKTPKGDAFRNDMASKFEFDIAAPCPHGIPWDATRETIATLTVKSRPVAPSTPAAQSRGAAWFAHGAAGLAKAAAGHALNAVGATSLAKNIGRARDETIEARRAICMTCDKSKKLGGVLDGCSVCSCSFWGKLVNANERCPLAPPKWEAEKPVE